MKTLSIVWVLEMDKVGSVISVKGNTTTFHSFPRFTDQQKIVDYIYNLH